MILENYIKEDAPERRNHMDFLYVELLKTKVNKRAQLDYGKINASLNSYADTNLETLISVSPESVVELLTEKGTMNQASLERLADLLCNIKECLDPEFRDPLMERAEAIYIYLDEQSRLFLNK